MVNLNKLFEQRIQRIMLMVQAQTTKIVKKEMRKFKKELIKKMVGG